MIRPQVVWTAQGLLLVLVALAACASPGPPPGQRIVRPAATATPPAATATPTDLPTAVPVAPVEPTASPPPPPRPAATPTRSGITIILLPSPFRAVRGQRIVYTVRTTARTACSITIGYAGAPALPAALPNAGGDASWTWTVGPAAPPGTWPITVACGTASGRTTVTIGG